MLTQEQTYELNLINAQYENAERWIQNHGFITPDMTPDEIDEHDLMLEAAKRDLRTYSTMHIEFLQENMTSYD